jgi:hypothetical protein
LNVRQFWIGGILLSTALSSSAITLGRYSGAAVLGRPLDIRIQAMLAPGELVADICVSADVLYGETKLSPVAVRATLQRAAPDAQASVRIQSSLAIDEPVVSILVRAGCTAPFTRQYVLLADPSRELARPATTSPAGGGPAVPRLPLAEQSPAVAAQIGAAVAPTGSPLAGVQRPVRERTKVPASSSANRASSVVRKPAAARPMPAAAPRLELDAIDLSLAIERDPVLKLSPILLSEPTSSEEARIAASRLWQAINASPEDILRDAGRLEAMTAEVASLRESQAGSQTTISELTSRLEHSRYWQWMVAALSALLALALLAMFWMWRQQKTRARFADDKAWWNQEEAVKPVAVRSSVLPRSAAASAAHHLDLDLTLPAASSRPTPRPRSRTAEPGDSRQTDQESTPLLQAADQVEFASSRAPSRSVATEELFDVQLQADFFISLGQDEQAIKVLCEHIAESQVPSALTYLDLLKIYHRLGREDEYERLRADFNGLFNAGAPAFERFSDEGRGLEHYEHALGRIQALWLDPRVLDVIEQSIFRAADGPEAEVFDLEAYRELLLLYAMAKEMIERKAVDGESPRDFESTRVQALAATARRGAARSIDSVFGGNTMPMDQQPPASPNLGLDVNLDDLSELSAFEASLPELDLALEPTAQAVRRVAGPGSGFSLTQLETLDFTPPDEPVPSSDKSR